MENRKVIIVGAGIGGLATGYWLCQRGYEVEILEASDHPGGRMLTLERKGDRIDVGAQFYHSDYRYAYELMDAVNLSGEKRTITGKFQFRLDNGSTTIYDHRVPYMKMLGLHGNLKLYGFILKYIFLRHRFPMYRIVEDHPEYDNVEILDLFRGPKDKPLRDFLVTVMSMGENMGLPEWMSLYHFIHTFRLSTFTNFIALTRGTASLPEELAKRLPVQYDAPVRQLVMEKGRVVGVQMEHGGTVKRAGHVVVAVAPSSAARIMPDELEEQRRFFDSVIYSPFPMPIFYLDRPLRKDIWCYFNDPRLRKTFQFAVNGQAKVPEMVPSGKAILSAWSGYPMTLDLIDLPDDMLIRRAQEDVDLMLPGFSSWVEEVKVVRHPYAIARYPVGAYRKVLDFQEDASKLKGVSFVSDLFGGCYLEAAMWSAARAVSRVCGWGGTA